MRTVGEKLTHQACGVQPRWDACDLTTGSAALPQAELVCEGYMLGELEAGMRLSVAEKLWNACGQMLVLIEPGTPQGFANLRAVRERLTAMGAYVAAPCPQGSVDCPMTGENWCHFAVRVQRTRLHKALKGGDAPFEDEKFSYLVLTRQEPKHVCRMRVLRHAQIAPGRITVPVCGEAGEKLLTVTKKTRFGSGSGKSNGAKGCNQAYSPRPRSGLRRTLKKIGATIKANAALNRLEAALESIVA